MIARDFKEHLDESVRVHGHLCPGQVLGVRMSLLGLKRAGISHPKGTDRKKLMVFVEMDRCATDAVQSVTGCSLGKRSLKFMDYGKMAATFLNMETGRAVRVVAREEAREQAREYFPEKEDKYEAQLNAYMSMPDGELFSLSDVKVSVRPEDMPGRPLSRVRCGSCGEHVQDKRELYKDGRQLCRACAGDAYYAPAGVFLNPGVMQNCHIEGSSGGNRRLGIRSKLWIEADGEPVFGRGRMMLLHAIEKHGSISHAAREISISYRKAWSYINAMEERLGIRLVERHAGGKDGGGTALTREAEEFLEKYRALEEGIRDTVDARFREIFGG